MGNASSALVDATEAEVLDASYVKVYYRKAAALKALSRFADAKVALAKGLAMKPDDKDMQALLQKLETDIAQQGAKGSANNAVKPARTTVSTSSGVTSSNTTGISSASSSGSVNSSSSSSSSSAKKAPAAVKPKSSSDEKSIGDDDDDDENLGNIRGYKKTSDGRVTTFFNNELDETAKKLIGDIAPKKLEGSSTSGTEGGAAAGGDATALENGSSAWNSAGTYEERILSPWAAAALRRLLGELATHLEAATDISARDRDACATTSPLESVDICVTDIDTVTGDAQVTMMRGKKKYICDYTVELKWSLSVKHAASTAADVVQGKLQVLDITADKEYEIGSAIEVTHFNGSAVSSQSALPKHAALLVSAYIKSSASSQPRGLQALLHKAVMQFCDEFKTK